MFGELTLLRSEFQFIIESKSLGARELGCLERSVAGGAMIGSVIAGV